MLFYSQLGNKILSVWLGLKMLSAVGNKCEIWGCKLCQVTILIFNNMLDSNENKNIT